MKKCRKFEDVKMKVELRHDIKMEITIFEARELLVLLAKGLEDENLHLSILKPWDEALGTLLELVSVNEISNVDTRRSQ